MDCILYVWLQMCSCVDAVETSLSVAIKTQSSRIVTHAEEKEKWNNISSNSNSSRAQSIAIE